MLEPPDGLTTSVSRRTRLRLCDRGVAPDRKSTRLNSSHANISYAVFCLKKKETQLARSRRFTPHVQIPHTQQQPHTCILPPDRDRPRLAQLSNLARRPHQRHVALTLALA